MGRLRLIAATPRFLGQFGALSSRCAPQQVECALHPKLCHCPHRICFSIVCHSPPLSTLLLHCSHFSLLSHARVLAPFFAQGPPAPVGNSPHHLGFHWFPCLTQPAGAGLPSPPPSPAFSLPSGLLVLHLRLSSLSLPSLSLLCSQHHTSLPSQVRAGPVLFCFSVCE